MNTKQFLTIVAASVAAGLVLDWIRRSGGV